MFPIRDSIPAVRTPVVVYLIIAANTAVFLYQEALGANASIVFSYTYGLVPIRYFDPDWGLANGLPASDYWPFLTAAFLHGGWLHIILNMWMLFIFGQTMEGRMGAIPFLAFYLACAAASIFAHAWFNATSEVPVVGASGAIAGVIGAYALTFPKARITLIVPVIFIPLIFTIPAIAFALIWFAVQVLQGTSDILAPSMDGGIAWWAHIGGFIAGMVLLPVFLAFAPAREQGEARQPWQPGPWG